jgi:hypothetical protein
MQGLHLQILDTLDRQIFWTQFKEHVQAITANKQNSRYAQHILETQHIYDNRGETMEILETQHVCDNVDKESHCCKFID